MMFFESIQQRSVLFLDRALVIVKKHDAPKPLMDETLRIKLSSQGNPAVLLIAVDSKFLIEQIVETAFNVVHFIKN